MRPRERPPGLALDAYPKRVRAAWPEWALLQGHAAYNNARSRDPLTVAMESEYQRRRRKARWFRRSRQRVVAQAATL